MEGLVAHPVFPRPLGPFFFDVEGLFLAGSFAVGRNLGKQCGGYAPELAFGKNAEHGIRLCAYFLLMAISRGGHGRWRSYGSTAQRYERTRRSP